MEMWVLFNENGMYSDYRMNIMGIYPTAEQGMAAVDRFIDHVWETRNRPEYWSDDWGSWGAWKNPKPDLWVKHTTANTFQRSTVALQQYTVGAQIAMERHEEADHWTTE